MLIATLFIFSHENTEWSLGQVYDTPSSRVANSLPAALENSTVQGFYVSFYSLTSQFILFFHGILTSFLSAWVTCTSRWVGTGFQNILFNTQKNTAWKQDFILVAKLKESCKQWLNKYSSDNLWSSGATQMNALSILNIWRILTERTIINAERALFWHFLPPVSCAQHLFHLTP